MFRPRRPRAIGRMDFKVIFKDPFWEDLEGIVRMIAIHDPVAARRLGETIIRIGESLSFFRSVIPRSGNDPGSGGSSWRNTSKSSTAYRMTPEPSRSSVAGMGAGNRILRLGAAELRSRFRPVGLLSKSDVRCSPPVNGLPRSALRVGQLSAFTISAFAAP